MDYAELRPGWLSRQMAEARAAVDKWPAALRPLLSINNSLICRPCSQDRPNDWICQCPTESDDSPGSNKMPKTTTTTTVEYPVEEFIAMIRDAMFNGRSIDVRFVIEEVGGDPLDRYPGNDEVTKVRIEFEGLPDLKQLQGNAYQQKASE